MRTEQDTIELLNQLIAALQEMHRLWDEIEAWSAVNLEPIQKAA